MKRLFIFLTIFILAGCSATGTRQQPVQDIYASTIKAEFNIQNVQRDERDGKWFATVFYEIRNNGNVQIAQYDVYFDITFENGSTTSAHSWGPIRDYEEGGLGEPLAPGGFHRGVAAFGPYNSEVKSVIVANWKLRQY